MLPENTSSRRLNTEIWTEEPSRFGCKLWNMQSLPMQLPFDHFGQISRLTILQMPIWL